MNLAGIKGPVVESYYQKLMIFLQLGVQVFEKFD